MILIMGIALAFNILVLLKKLELNRYLDAIFDAIILVILVFILGSTFNGMMVGSIASAIVSVYFFYNEPKLSKYFNFEDEEEEEIKNILKKG